MNERPTGEAAVTGVAKGALGTGTALDETQEWVVPAALQAPPEPARVEAVEAVESDPVVAQPPRRRTPSSSHALGSPRTAGIAAAVLLALIGVTAVVTSFGNSDAGAAPVAPAQVTTAPTEAPPADVGGGKDKDEGDGKGNGNGNGNGGNGNGNGGGRGN